MRERIYSRRKILFGSAFAGATLLGADRILKDGFGLRSPDLRPVPKRINITPRGVQLNRDVPVDLETGFKPLRLNDRTYVYYNTDDDLIFQHDDAWFEKDKEYAFSHRSGNKREMVDKALKMDADLIDMDVRSLPSGKLSAAHGVVRDLELGPVTIGGQVDVDVIGARTRIPRTPIDMLNFISSKSTSERPLFVSMQLKGGDFDNQASLRSLLAGISRNGLPVWMFSSNQKAIDNMYGACEDYAKLHGPVA